MSSNDGEDYNTLCEDICMLTCTLNDVDVLSAQNYPARKHGSALRLLQQILTLLTIDAPPTLPKTIRDLYASSAISVTGRLYVQDGALEGAVLVTQIVSARGEQLDTIQVEEAIETVPAEQALESWREREHKDHFSDVFAILNWRRANSNLRGEHQFRFYMINHAYRQIAGRMLKSDHLFTEHPIRVLQRRRTTIAPESMPFKVRILNGFALERVTSFNLRRDSKSDAFIVDEDNVALWISLFCAVYERLESLLIETVMVVEGTVRRPKDQLSADEVIEVMGELEVFNTLLRASFLDSILTDKALLYDLVMSHFTSRLDLKQQGRLVAHTCTSTTDIIEDEYAKAAGDDLMASGEQPGYYIVRHFKSIVAWTNAMHSLAALDCLPFPLRVHKVMISTPNITITQDRIAAFQTALQARIPHIVKHPRVFQRNGSKLDLASIHGTVLHAAAGMMGLVCASLNTETTLNLSPPLQIDDAKNPDARRIIRQGFSVREAAIGIREVCCWCCWRLHQLLRSDITYGEDAPPEDDRYPLFLLPGTHATIVPWHPPQNGIPISVLKTLRTELESELEETMRHFCFTPQSGDSSPRSSDEWSEFMDNLVGGFGLSQLDDK